MLLLSSKLFILGGQFDLSKNTPEGDIIKQIVLENWQDSVTPNWSNIKIFLEDVWWMLLSWNMSSHLNISSHKVWKSQEVSTWYFNVKYVFEVLKCLGSIQIFIGLFAKKKLRDRVYLFTVGLVILCISIYVYNYL